LTAARVEHSSVLCDDGLSIGNLVDRMLRPSSTVDNRHWQCYCYYKTYRYGPEAVRDDIVVTDEELQEVSNMGDLIACIEGKIHEKERNWENNGQRDVI